MSFGDALSLLAFNVEEILLIVFKHECWFDPG